jgi:hypothetical protein
MLITSDHIKAVYGMLAEMPPFNKWNLPDKHDVKFHAMKTNRWHADYLYDKGHRIRVSIGLVSHLETLVKDVAHEMIHLHLKHNKIHERRDHGVAFRIIATLVSKELGFDPSDL